MRSLSGRIVMLGMAMALTATADAQQPQVSQQPRFDERVDVSNVVIDVRVVDDHGAALLGLQTGDFSVNIGGKPAVVRSALWTGGGSGSTASLSSSPRVPASATPAEPGQLLVLLFQKSLVNERVRGFVRLVEQSRQLVRDLPPSAQVAVLVFEHSLRVWSDFTTDRAAIDRILERGILHERSPTSVAPGSPSVVAALRPDPRRIATIERAFEAIGQALEPLPGSKAIAFIGYGMGLLPFGSRMDTGVTHARFGASPTDLSDQLIKNKTYLNAWKALTTARVSVFSLDVTNADSHSLAAGMQIIAADTGGFYANNLDFPERQIRLLTGALQGHYVLFVEPPSDPASHELTVAVAASRSVAVFATSSYRALERKP